MIMVIGEYYSIINSNTKSLSGLAYNVSKEISKSKCSTLYVGKISSDEVGLKFLDSLVDNEIGFDPSLCNNEFPSPSIEINYKDNKNKYNFEDSSMITLSKDELVEIFNLHDDINVIHLSLLPLLDDSSIQDLMQSINSIEPSVIKYINLSINYFDDLSLHFDKKVIDTMIDEADIIQVNKSFLKTYYPSLNSDDALSEFRTRVKNASILYHDEKLLSYNSSNRVEKPFKISSTCTMNGENINSLIASTFLSYLHNNDIFGDYIEDPIFKESNDVIENAIDEIKRVINLT